MSYTMDLATYLPRPVAALPQEAALRPLALSAYSQTHAWHAGGDYPLLENGKTLEIKIMLEAGKNYREIEEHFGWREIGQYIVCSNVNGEKNAKSKYYNYPKGKADRARHPSGLQFQAALRRCNFGRFSVKRNF